MPPRQPNINQNVSQGSVSQAPDDQDIGDDLAVGDDLTVAGDLAVAGASTVTGAETVGGPLTFGSTLLSDVQQSETVAVNKTLDEGDNGVFQVVTVDGVVITLPSTVVGYSYTIINGAADGAALVSISPAAADKIMGNGFTATDNKDAQNTKATAKKGDLMRLIGDGVNGWMVAEVRGIWARE